MSTSKIEWTEATWNPVTGCTKCSPGCEHCYAERMSTRLAGRCGYPADDPFRVWLRPERLEEPLRRRKPTVYFVVSMGDLFHDDVPPDFLDRVFRQMEQNPRHRFLVLTQRPERMEVYLERRYALGHFQTHIGLGVTVCNQAEADAKIPLLLNTPAAMRFVSYEPALRPVDLSYNGLGMTCPTCGGCGEIEDETHPDHPTPTGDGADQTWCLDCNRDPAPIVKGLDWIICGGESGPGARPMHPDWARSLREKCEEAGVPFFFKQWGAWAPLPEPFRYSPAIGSGHRDYARALRAFKHRSGATKIVDDRPEGWGPYLCNYGAIINGQTAIGRVGKKAAGRLLDRVEHNARPEAFFREAGAV